MSNQKPTQAKADVNLGPPAVGLNPSAQEIAEKIGDLRAIQPEVGSPHKSITGILDVLEMQTKVLLALEVMLVRK